MTAVITLLLMEAIAVLMQATISEFTPAVPVAPPVIVAPALQVVADSVGTDVRVAFVIVLS